MNPKPYRFFIKMILKFIFLGKLSYVLIIFCSSFHLKYHIWLAYVSQLICTLVLSLGTNLYFSLLKATTTRIIYSSLNFLTEVLNLYAVVELTKYHESSEYRICAGRGRRQEARGRTSSLTTSSHSLNSFSCDLGCSMTNAFTVELFNLWAERKRKV